MVGKLLVVIPGPRPGALLPRTLVATVREHIPSSAVMREPAQGVFNRGMGKCWYKKIGLIRCWSFKLVQPVVFHLPLSVTDL